VLVLQLLTYAAKDLPSRPADGVLSSIDESNNREIQWVLKGGLGPLLYRALGKQAEHVSVPWRDRLLSADLSAQVRHAALVETAKEVIDICQDKGIRVTLLKGISISDQYYPAARLRPMGDIDILIPAKEYASAESALLGRGYMRHPSYQPGEGSHHGVPLLDPRRGDWVELHTTLFPRSETMHCGRLFDPSRVWAHSTASEFHGRSIYRLNDEFQLVYIAYSWIRDLTLSGIHPSFLASLLDAIYLLKASGKVLNWRSLFDWLESEMATASLYVMLAYLARHGLAETTTPTLTLASRQRIVGPLQLWLIHKTLDLFLLAGRPLGRVFRPPVPGRYSLRYQLRKRSHRLPNAPP
jgi:Uncharacterised nucleotidyltransferase